MKCFVIMPFGDPKKDPDYHSMLEHIYLGIKSTVESIAVPEILGQKISCHRADKTLAPGEIIPHVIENIVDSFIVIADLSDMNPNVFYELGVRHAVSNNTILITRNLDNIPFDLKQLRTRSFSYSGQGLESLQNSLKEAIQSILVSPEKIDNPVRRFIFTQKESKFDVILEFQNTVPRFSKMINGKYEVLQDGKQVTGEVSLAQMRESGAYKWILPKKITSSDSTIRIELTDDDKEKWIKKFYPQMTVEMPTSPVARKNENLRGDNQ